MDEGLHESWIGQTSTGFDSEYRRHLTDVREPSNTMCEDRRYIRTIVALVSRYCGMHSPMPAWI